MRQSSLWTICLCVALPVLTLNACGSSHDSSSPAPANPAPSTVQTTGAGNATAAGSYTQVASIIAANCATSGCHGSGSSQTVFVGNEANVDANKAEIASQINSGAMPLTGSLSAADKATLLSFCNGSAE